jgi:hypothetical protein
MATVIWSERGSPPWQSAQVTPPCACTLDAQPAVIVACLSFTAP